jgi:prophage antirepressor-like protein
MPKTVSPSAVDSLRAMQFKATPVRITSSDDALWFVASDIFKCLGVQNTTNAVQNLSQDEARLIPILGQRPVNALSEHGLRKRLMRCKKPEASALLDWITHEAIPAYIEAAQSKKHSYLHAVQRLAARVAELEQRLAALSALLENTPHAMQAALRTQ